MTTLSKEIVTEGGETWTLDTFTIADYPYSELWLILYFDRQWEPEEPVIVTIP